LQDEELLRRIASGAETALDTLMARHGARFQRFFERYLGDRESAEDLLIELFTRIWKHADRFDPQRGKAITWMYRIATNLAASAARSRSRRRKREAAAEAYWPAPDAAHASFMANRADPLETLSRAESASRLHAALASLPEPLRAVVILRHFHDLPFAEVGTVLAIPTGTAKSRMHRALLLLRRGLRPEVKP
jgi:RNA polymerase sigma-70 factor (ECF subfamily)